MELLSTPVDIYSLWEQSCGDVFRFWFLAAMFVIYPPVAWRLVGLRLVPSLGIAITLAAIHHLFLSPVLFLANLPLAGLQHIFNSGEFPTVAASITIPLGAATCLTLLDAFLLSRFHLRTRTALLTIAAANGLCIAIATGGIIACDRYCPGIA